MNEVEKLCGEVNQLKKDKKEMAKRMANTVDKNIALEEQNRALSDKFLMLHGLKGECKRCGVKSVIHEGPIKEITEVKTEIKLLPELMGKVVNGEKTATTRLGIKPYTVGFATLVNSKDPCCKINIHIEQVSLVKFSNIPIKLCIQEGYAFLDDFKEVLKNIYGDKINPHSILTAIYFKNERAM